MKEKLSKIRDALKYQENMAINGMASHRDCILGSCATALTLLDSILADLDSHDVNKLLKDMVMEVEWTHEATMPIPLYERIKAAIRIIKGE